MYSDNPRYYQPPPPQPRYNSSTEQNWQPHQNQQYAQGNQGGGGGRYGQVGIGHRQPYSPTPHRAISSGRMRAWDDEVLSGNTAQTGFQPSGPPHMGHQQQQYPQAQQEQQWGHMPRHSLAGALSPGPPPFAGTTRSDLPHKHTSYHPRAYNPAYGPPAGIPPSVPSAMTSSQPHHSSPSQISTPDSSVQTLAPLNPLGTSDNSRRSSLARSAGEVANGGDRRASGAGGKGKNKRKNKRRQDDEREGEHDQKHLQAQGQAVERGAKKKVQGPPPKAKLGGPGGGTYGERRKQAANVEPAADLEGDALAVDGSASAEAASNAVGTSTKQTTQVQAQATTDQSSEDEPVQDATPMYKDKPIEVRLPHDVSRSDTAIAAAGGDLDPTLEDREEARGQEEHQLAVDNFTGPQEAAKVPLPETPDEEKATDAEAGVMWKGEEVIVALPSVPPPPQAVMSDASAWQPGPISQSQAVAQASTDGINESSKLDAPIALRVQAGDAHQQDILSPGFASPGGNDDFGASPSTIGRTRENSTSDYQATISRAAYLRPSAPAFLPAARVFQQSVTTPSVRNGIDEFPSVSMQNRVVSDTTGEGPRKKLRPSAPSFTPSHSSGPSRTSMSSAASHSRLNVAAQTFSPKKATKALADDLLALPDFSSTPGPSSRPSMTKVATSPASAARGTLRAGAPSFMPSGQGTFTFKPPVTAKGRPSLISAFERPGPDEMRDRSTEDRSPEKVMKSGYLGGLGSGMSLPLKGATILKTSPTEPDSTVDHTTEDATGEGIGENKEPKPEVSPAAPSEGDKFGSMSASELFFRPPIPTPGVEKDDIFSALGITPLKSKATSGNVSRSSLSGVEEIRHKPEASYDSEAGMRSGYVEDLGDYEGEDYGDEMGHAASSDIEPDLEEGNDRGKVEHETARAHLPTESFGLPSARDTEEVATLGSAMLPSLQRVPRYIPQDQPSSPTTPVISESPMHHPPTGARYYTAPETPHKTLQGEQDVQISASPTPARRPSNVRLKSPTDQQIDSMQDRTFGDSTQYRPSPIQQQALNGDHAADDARFRNWIFPTPDKYERPGINRRYTMPLRDIATAPAYPAEEMPGPAGVASTTLAERVNVLRDVLGRAEGSYEPAARAEDVFGSGRSKAKGEHAEAPHRKVSVEFPIRQKTLKIVNATPKRQSLVDVEEIADTGGTGMAGTQMAIIDMLNEVKEALAGLALAANEPAKGESGLELRQILATVEGMRGDVLEVSGRRGRDHYEERQRDNELANLREQLMEQNERFDRLAEQLQAQESKEDTSRSDEMFTALLSGQHAMLDKFTAFSEDREVEGEQLVAAADALRIAREAAEKDRDLVKQKDDMIHALRQQLAEVKVSARTAAAERDELRTATAARASSEEGLRKELLDVKREVGEKKRAHEGMEEELTRARAGRQAAEAERDAIAGALGEAHGWREDTEAELTELRHQLELERSKPASTPVVTQIDMSSQVAELFSANKLFQDDLFAQIAFLQKDIVESREAQGEAVEEMKKEKGKLQSSIDRLESELDEAKTRATRSEIQSITEAEHNLATQTVLDSKLSSAIAARDTAQLKLAEVEKDVAKLREEKESLQVIATERSAATRQYEARLQALAQENVYWRQFALSYDRREYRKFLGSKPFRDADGNPVDSTLTGRIDHDAVTVIRETTEGSGQPANPSPVLQTPFAPAGDRAFLTPTATPLNKGKGKAPPSTGGSSLQDTPDLSSSTSTVLSTRAPSKQ